MFIQTENTPNPSTLKFIPEKNILKKGNFEFKSKSEAKISPLAMKLFENEDVKNVFFGIDFKDFVFSYNYSHQFGDINFGSGGFHQITIGFNFLRGSIECDCF